MIKRWFDFTLSAVAIFILLPAMALIAMLIRQKLGSPVLFHQVRRFARGELRGVAGAEELDALVVGNADAALTLLVPGKCPAAAGARSSRRGTGAAEPLKGLDEADRVNGRGEAQDARRGEAHVNSFA